MTTSIAAPHFWSLRPDCSLILAMTLCALAVSPARAVVVQSAAPNNTTPVAPASDPGFANIGVSSTSGASVTYLGNRWILTANHVTIDNSLYPIRFGSFSSGVIPTSKVQLQTSTGVAADLAMWQLAADPKLPGVILSDASPTVGSSVVMIGNGRTRGTPLSDDSGYNLDNSSHVIRWGTNQVSATGLTENYSPGTTRAFHTRFDNIGPTSNEAQASKGDSGGGVFYYDRNHWELAGIMYLGSDDGAPIKFADESSMVDVKYYRDQIKTVMLASLPQIRGDANGDGLVSFTDLSELLLHYNMPGTYSGGDFNLSDTVDFSDMQLLLLNYNQTVDTTATGALAAGFAAVPEPDARALLGAAVLALLGALAVKLHRRSAQPTLD